MNSEILSTSDYKKLVNHKNACAIDLHAKKMTNVAYRFFTTIDVFCPVLIIFMSMVSSSASASAAKHMYKHLKVKHSAGQWGPPAQQY